MMIAAAAAMALVPSCGSGSATPAPAAAVPVPAISGLTRCATSALAMSVDDSQAGAAAGSTFYPIDFTNRSSAVCGMTGYPGVSFVTAPDSTGRQIGAAAQRNSSFGVTTVRLAAGGQAHAWLQVAQAASYPVATCHSMTARGLRVYPPGEGTAGYVARDFIACSAGSAPLLTVLPVRPGKGTRGNTP